MVSISCLPTLTMEEARRIQFRIIDAITQEFSGDDWLTRGELGVGRDNTGSAYTRAAERSLARAFGTEDAVFVTGAGTGALRAALFATLPPLSRILIHDAPMYSTTAVTFRAAGYQAIRVNMNEEAEISATLQREEVQAVYIQHTRQSLTDCYALSEVIRTVRLQRPQMLVIVDDNYAIANTPRTGVEVGADVSAFSAFKLLGPEGIGILLCTQAIGRQVRADMYSGGTRVQGFQAQDALIGISTAFVANAITRETADEIVVRLRTHRLPGVSEAHLANVQSPVVLIRFNLPIAAQVVACSAHYGAAPFPVGAMSRYELIPMFYRVSGSLMEALGMEEARHWIRINPMRAGSETVLRILEKTLEEVQAHVS